MKVIIIGGGIIGLSSALYLQRSGCEVIVLEKNDFTDSCCYGSAGYICPSHFIPLATPGMVRKGIKWMWDSKSPFYIQPRFSKSLIRWGIQFIRSANKEKADAAVIPLRDISLLSKREIESWKNIPGFEFFYEQKGVLEIFQTKENEIQAKHFVQKASDLGFTDTKLISIDEIRAMEPHTKIIARGAIVHQCDAHCDPEWLMKNLIGYLKTAGVKLVPRQEVIRVEINNGIVNKLLTHDKEYSSDEIVLATGSWSAGLAKQLNLNLPVIPGRGYSLTLEDSPYHLNYPAILMEGKVAVTPMGKDKIRFGGTMEITTHQTPPRMNRVKGILETVRSCYPEFDITLPSVENIWFGYRPCSADGMPFIGRSPKHANLTIATGHSMLGLSLGPATGKLIDEIVNNKSLSMELKPFAVDRFR